MEARALEIELTIPTADVNFQARQRGKAPRAVFLHGFGGDLQTWDPLFSELGEVCPTLRYDLRGFGASIPRRAVPFTHAEDLSAILEATGIGPVHLVGVSMGGGVALNFTLDHPEHVRSLVLISPGLVAWEWSEAWQVRWQPIVNRARAGAMDEARRLWWEHPLFDTSRAGDTGRRLLESIMRYSGVQWVTDSHRPMLPDVDRLHRLETRTLLLTGGRDLPDFKLIGDLLEAAAGNLQRVNLPSSGHMLHLENPGTCAHLIRDFLA